MRTKPVTLSAAENLALVGHAARERELARLQADLQTDVRRLIAAIEESHGLRLGSIGRTHDIRSDLKEIVVRPKDPQAPPESAPPVPEVPKESPDVDNA